MTDTTFTTDHGTVTVRTNNHYRDLCSLDELSESARGEFDYIAEEEDYSPRLINYLGAWYDTYGFMAVQSFRRGTPVEWLQGWDGVLSDSAFSCTLVRFSEDHESVVMGRAWW